MIYKKMNINEIKVEERKMSGIDYVKDFISQGEEFKKTDSYQTMPPELRDFFNEELGKFKYLLLACENRYEEKQIKDQ